MKKHYPKIFLWWSLFMAAVCFNHVQAQVSVTATAGTPTGSYTNLSSAFTAINSGTHQGAITIDISSGFTDAAVSVLNSSGAGSASYTSVLVRPVNDGITISFPSTAGRGVIELNGADNVTIDGDNPNTGGINRNLTIQNTAANTVAFASCVRIALSTLVTSADNVTVKNCNLTGSGTGRNISSVITEVVTWGVIVSGGASTTLASNPPAALASATTTIGAGITAGNLVLNNNNIQTVSRGISVNGSSATVATGMVISNNIIGNATQGAVDQVWAIGITAQGSSNGIISGNTVRVEGYIQSSTPNKGIDVGTISTAGPGVITIEKNMVQRVINNDAGTWNAFGINIAGGTGHLIRNNFIGDCLNSQAAGTGAFSTTFGAFGIRLAGGTGHKVYYNTVHFTGTVPGVTSTDLIACLGITGTGITGCDIRNNVFSNRATGGNPTLYNTVFAGIYLPSGGTSAMNLTLNNNAYYQGGAVGAGIAQVSTTGNAANLYLAANFNPAATTPASNLRSYISLLNAAGTNGNASGASSVAPPLVSASDLHVNIAAPNYTDLDTKAAVIAGTTDDIDGDVRNVTTPDIGADEFTVSACSGTPTAGNITGSSSVCSGSGTTLTLTGSTAGTGITYQWASSTTSGGPYTNMGTSINQATGAIPVTTYYVCTVTCAFGGSSVTSEFAVTVNPTPTGTASGPGTGVTYQNLTYTVTGFPGGATFQWQSSTTSGGPYANIPGATGSSAVLTANGPGTFYVVCVVTVGSCSFTTNQVTTVITLAGDDVCAANPLVVGINGPYTTIGATLQPGEATPPNGSCTGQASWCSAASGTVWFSFVAPPSGRISLHFLPGNWDSEIALWSAPNCSALLSGGGTLLAANDDSTGLTPYNAYISPICLTPGTTYYVQVDGYGTTTNGNFKLLLKDEGNAVPVISGCPGNISVSTDPGNCGAMVSWTPPNATDADNCLSPLSFTSSHAPGSMFPVGTTTVTYTASDGVNAPVTCSFNVTVTDNEAPSITCPSNVTANTDPGACSSTSFSLGAPVVSDNCGIASLTNNSLGSFPIGTTTVTWTLTDIHSNVSTCAQTITVIDAENPTITCPSNVTVNNDPGVCTVSSVALGSPVTADNCTVMSVNNNAPVTYPAGMTTVTWTVTDASSNLNTCAQTVTVIDNEAPVVSGCPADITINANNTGCTAMVSWTAPTAVDNCAASVTVTSSHNSGDIFPLGTTTVTYMFNDGNGNSSTCSFQVTVNNDLTVSATASDVLCNGGMTGSTDATVSGGTSGFTYDWDNDGTGDNDDMEDISSLAAGTYNLVVTDANGCMANTSVVVNEPLALSVSISSSSDPSVCGASDGSIDATVSGGVMSYTYDWDNDGTGDNDDNEDLSGLPEGTYNLVVTDANMCTAMVSITLNDPNAPAVTVDNIMNTLCNGSSDGSIDVTVTLGGTATSYTALWNDPSSTTTEDVNGLSAGNYTLVITDDLGCSTTIMASVNQPAAISVTPMVTNITCNGGNDGSIDITVTGGTPGYVYDWDNDGTGDNDDSEDLMTLTAGTYSVVVTDNNGCTFMDSYIVAEPAAIMVTNNVNTCNGMSYTIGTNTYTTSGTYTDVFVAVNGCDSTVITNLTVNGTINTGLSVGPTTITAQSTVGSFQWINCATGLPLAGQTSAAFTPTANGSYAVIITVNGCSDTSSCVNVTGIGIAEVAANELALYPNPSNGLFTIVAPVQSRMQVMNLLGETMTVINLSKGKNSIDLSQIACGTYVVRITNAVNGSEVQVSRIVIQK